MKFLLLLLVVGVGVWFLLRGRKRSAPASESKQPGTAATGTPMAACAHCGLHLPEPDALFDAQGRAFCGDEHRRLGVRRP